MDVLLKIRHTVSVLIFECIPIVQSVLQYGAHVTLVTYHEQVESVG